MLAALRRAVLGSQELNEADLSRASGVEPSTIRHLWRAMGFPDPAPGERAFTEADARALRDVGAVLETRDEQTVVQDARVLSSLFAGAASVIARRLADDIRDYDDAGMPAARAAELVEHRLIEVSALLEYLFRRQLLTELTRQVTAHVDQLGATVAQPTTVIFADLVGFTTLTQELDEPELARLVARFQAIAFDVVAGAGGRVVKTLGDEVMVVCDDVEVGLDVAMTLAGSYAEEADIPDVRVGLAYGPVLAVQGDFFGPTVNLAARLVGIAPPGEVLISDGARLALPADGRHRLNEFGTRSLKGIGWTSSWIVGSPDVAAESDDEALKGFYAALRDDDAEELYERAPCGYLSTTPDGTIIKVNQTFLTWTGYQRSDLVGRRQFVDLLTGGGRIYHETHYSPMLRTQGTVGEIALDVVSADRRRIPVLVNAALERDDAGAPIVARIAVFDATDRRQYERELLRAKQQAEASEQEARLLAHALQRILLPPGLPVIGGLDIAAAYRPAGRGDEVGGDFYDVFEAASGEWAVVIGDVQGKGVEAGLVTARARYAIRAAAPRLRAPSAVLAAVNRTLVEQAHDRFCTVAAASLRETSGRWTLTVASGGHPLPLLLRDGMAPSPVGGHGSLVGVFESAAFEDAEVALQPGDQVVFFTDGVTEARHGRAFYGDERLATRAQGPAPAQATVDRILSDVLDFQDDDPADDIAIVVVHVP